MSDELKNQIEALWNAIQSIHEKMIELQEQILQIQITLNDRAEN